MKFFFLVIILSIFSMQLVAGNSNADDDQGLSKKELRAQQKQQRKAERKAKKAAKKEERQKKIDELRAKADQKRQAAVQAQQKQTEAAPAANNSDAATIAKQGHTNMTNSEFSRWSKLSAIKNEPSLLDDKEILRRNIMHIYPYKYRQLAMNKSELQKQTPTLKAQLLEDAKSVASRSKVRLGLARIVGEYDVEKKGFNFDLTGCLVQIPNKILNLNVSLKHKIFVPVPEKVGSQWQAQNLSGLHCIFEVASTGNTKLMTLYNAHRSRGKLYEWTTISTLPTYNYSTVLDVKSVKLINVTYGRDNLSMSDASFSYEVDLSGHKNNLSEKLPLNTAFLGQLKTQGCYCATSVWSESKSAECKGYCVAGGR